MAKRRFSFSDGGPERVEVDVGFGNRSAKVLLDGVLVGQIKGEKNMKAGWAFTLSDGSQLSVIHKTGFNGGIDVHHNGRLLPGSASSPSFVVVQGGNAALFVGVISTVIGILATTGTLQGFANAGYGWVTAYEGLIFLGLGALMRWKQSFAASLLAAGLWSFDVLIGFYLAVEAGASPLRGIILRGIILVLLVKAVPAAKTLETSRRNAQRLRRQQEQQQHAHQQPVSAGR